MANLTPYAPTRAKANNDAFTLEDHHNLRLNFDFNRQAMHVARYSESTGITVATATETTLTFSTTDYAFSLFIGSSSRITTIIPGKYVVMAQAEFPANSTGHRKVIIRNQDGVEICANQVDASANVDNIQAICEDEIPKNGWVEVRVFQNSGGNQTVTGWFSARWVAP